MTRIGFDPEHGADSLTDYDLDRMTLEEPEPIVGPSCGPGKHRITMIPVCLVCGGIFQAEPSDA